jgi:hypothetical protein
MRSLTLSLDTKRATAGSGRRSAARSERDRSAALTKRLRLRPRSGLRIHRGATGVIIVPAVHHDAGTGSSAERHRHLAAITNADIGLLYRAMSSRVPSNTVAATNNGTVSLHRLEGAGLVASNDAHDLVLSDELAIALGIPGLGPPP